MKTGSWHRIVGIIGPGAMGSVLALELRQVPGTRVVFFGRQGPQGHRATLEWNRTHHELDIAAPNLAECRDVSIVFTTTKAHQLSASIATNAAYLAPGIPVVVACNGMVDEEMALLTQRYPFQWRRGTMTYAAKFLAPGRWRVTNERGTLAWGPWPDSQAEPCAIERELVAAIKGWEWQPDIAQHVREKWLFNSALNSLCGELNLKSNGESLKHRAALATLFAEAYRLGEELWGAWRETEEGLFRRLLALIEATAENQNSLMRDLEQGHRTESLYLAGLLTRASGSYPALQRAHAAIRAQEQEEGN